MTDLNEVVEAFIPQIVQAGQYAAQIQPHVKTSSKDKGNFMSDALTSADLSVQNFLEIFSLTKFPGYNFIGEEFEQSLNAHFFPGDADYTIYLDPIDGTYLYASQTDEWAVILSVCNSEGLQAAIVHMPQKNRCFSAIKGQGAKSYITGANNNIESSSELALASSSNKIVTFRGFEHISALRDKYEVINMADFEHGVENAVHMAGILDGRLLGGISYLGQLIDWGAIGFIAKEAGGFMSLLNGEEAVFSSKTKPYPILDNLLVTNSLDAHQEIVSRNLPARSN